MKKAENNYKKSGVNISLANKLVKHISLLSKKNVKKTKSNSFKEKIGGFGSLFDISNYKIKDPVIVSCTDGVGTKIDLANKFKKFDTIGIDLVAMCVNDLIVQGAKPLFFLDYIAVGKLNLTKTKKILKGIYKGCNLSNCELIGGETAEMPGVYEKNKFDLAGFSVGIVSKKKMLLKSQVKKNNIILAIPSSGIHSNGYSLVRTILKKNKIPQNLKKYLLKPTKIYVNEINKLGEKIVGGYLSILGATILFVSILTGNLYFIIPSLVIFGLFTANFIAIVIRQAIIVSSDPISLTVSNLTTLGFSGFIFGPAIVGYTAQYIGLTFNMYLLCVIWGFNGLCLIYLMNKK